jgi:UDP-glucose 4-epimerase
MRYFVTGGAGFVGMNLVQTLLGEENEVIVYDNLSSGKKEHLTAFLANPRFGFVQGDVLDEGKLTQSMDGADVVFHLAANSDIRPEAKSADIELQQGIIATFNVLRAMKRSAVRRIVFASSSTVYGDAKGQELTEDYGPLIPISFYGGSKLAAEALICAFCHMFEMKAWIFRLANIVGKGLTHGVIFDFLRKLAEDPGALEILGDGKQTKPYLHVTECVEGMLYGLSHADHTVNIFNLSPPDTVSVDRIAAIVAEEMGLKNVAFSYTGGNGGWKGDVPRVCMNSDRLRNLGWEAKMGSEEAVRASVREFLSQDAEMW